MGQEVLNDMNNEFTKAEIETIHRHANIGDDYCEYMYHRFVDCKPKERYKLFSFIISVHNYSNRQNNYLSKR